MASWQAGKGHQRRNISNEASSRHSRALISSHVRALRLTSAALLEGFVGASAAPDASAAAGEATALGEALAFGATAIVL